MPAPYDANAARIRIAPTLAGPFVTVAMIRSFSFDRGSESTTLQRWFGGRKLKAGERTLAFDFPVWYEPEDTDGQALAETAWATAGTVALQICPRGTSAGAKVLQFLSTVDTAPINADSEGESVEGTFTGTGDITTYSVVTLV